MQFSIGVEYALHCLVFMVDIPVGNSIGIKDMAEHQGVSETYLSKVFTKLRKASLVRATTGVKGGYELAKNPEDISFWDVIEAVEGQSYMFQCAEIRQRGVMADKNSKSESYKCPCLIKTVMVDAEEEMRNFLRKKTIGWLHNEVKYKIYSVEKFEESMDWFNKK